MSEAELTTPFSPPWKKGVRLSELNAVNASTMNRIRIDVLTSTMIVLVRALLRTPEISSAATASTRKTAGRLTVPPSPGGCESASGSVMPNAESSSSLRYWPQPTATAATETPYSRIRSQPMIHATSSPSVAYEYVYALPATGIDDASSAYDSAENAHVTPASTNDSRIDGPVPVIASPMITKMPVPMMAPSPSADRSSKPTTRRSWCPRSSASETSACVGLVTNSPPRSATAMGR